MKMAYMGQGSGILFDGDDARIEVRSLKIEAQVSSFHKRDSIRASTTTTFQPFC